MRPRIDLVSLAAGLAASIVSGYYLLADDPGLDDVGTVLVPLVLVVAGAALLLVSLLRPDRD